MAFSTSSRSGSKEYISSFSGEVLHYHNMYRRKHGVPELTLNKKLCSYATKWAEKCAKKSKLEHREKCDYGENLYSFVSSDAGSGPTAEEVVATWYNEVIAYKFEDQATLNQNTLHFSQMIWRDTKEMGTGLAKDKNGKWYVVAYYVPKGNIIGQFEQNVPKGNCSVCDTDMDEEKTVTDEQS